MSYEHMEVMLVNTIAEVRATESSLLQEFEQAKSGSGSNRLTAKYARLQQQISQVEVLLAAMDSAPIQSSVFASPSGRVAFAAV